MSTALIAEVKRELEVALTPIALEIVDESGRHVGHAGARGGGHVAVTIVSERFVGLSSLQRHRLVYAVLEECMASARLHALRLRALTPQEWGEEIARR